MKKFTQIKDDDDDSDFLRKPAKLKPLKSKPGKKIKNLDDLDEDELGLDDDLLPFNEDLDIDYDDDDD